MWELVNDTRWPAERTFARAADGAEWMLLVVKATYDLADDGSPSPSKAQRPILHAPVHEGDPTCTALRYETDFSLDKPRTDVSVHGVAYAPRGEPTIAMEASVTVGPLSKSIRVIGDRTWDRSLGEIVLGDAAPFTSMPIVYERAYGGADGDIVDDENPIGVGFASSPERLVGKPAANFERPLAMVPKATDRSSPIGFGPIARSWQPRRARAGTMDALWSATRRPLLPVDYDARFEQCAPDDQQVAGYLRGGEPIELRGLTPAGVLRSCVPATPVSARSRVAGRTVHHALRLHTLVLEPEARTLVVVWQASLPCHATLHSIRRTVLKDRVDG